MKRALLLSLLLLVSACSKEEAATTRCADVDAGAPVDPLLLSFLSRARAAHHIADNQESSGALAEAIVPLANLVTGPLPKGGAGELGPEVREVLADTRARLADLRSRLGAFDEALADVQAGLTQVQEPNYFRGHLLETEGLVEERHAKALDATNPSAAAATRRRAIELLEQAMSVQSRVIEAAPRPSARPAEPTAPAPSR